MIRELESKCKCVSSVNDELKKVGLELSMSFDVKGNAWPYMEATNELTREKGEKKQRRVLIPSYCPFCGIKTGVNNEQKKT
jgi:hypothetical protein